ncbi:hypothetical protein ACFYNO_25030 [Kitasatospora sp. NPDC006697]|uniref:hypothetical protein n=1 Tax=Kitasatospora sp. NPDC006697 TaxID=3364020 RepID=UPI0036BAA1F2
MTSAEKRAEREQRLKQRQAEHRAAAAAEGPHRVAAVEWDILRSAVGRLPAGQQEGEWARLAATLRALSSNLTDRHIT